MTELACSPLPENHRRALHANLSGVERDLQAIEDIIDGRRDDRIFAHFIDPLTPEQVEGFRQWLLQMRGALQQAKDRLGLDSTAERISRVISAHLSSAWVSLEDSRPKRLRGYGQVSPEHETLIEEVVSGLLARLPGRS